VSSSPTVAAIIVAGGRGERSGAGSIPKQYVAIAGRPLLSYAIEAFLGHPRITIVQPVIAADHGVQYASIGIEDPRLLPPVIGGNTRQMSVLAGLEALETHAPDLVLIHDGARPFVPHGVIEGVLLGLAHNEAVLPATPVIDTIKRSADGRTVGGTEDRTQLFAAQTPQGFVFSSILAAHRKAREFTDSYTDDTAIAEWAGMPVALSEGSPENIKVTLPGDFARAEHLLLQRRKLETRVGSGLDIHRLGPGQAITLGGVTIPHDRSLIGHSDADAGLHVLTDALLGALAEGDIGQHFPPGDARWRGEPSATFLSFAAGRVAARGGRIVHLDLTIVCERPRIGPHVPDMRVRIADICGISPSRVSVKATTSEKMGFVGREEGLMTLAAATIEVPETGE